MDNTLRIQDVSARYSLTARTLRYYEHEGLLQSIRREGCPFRLYDEAALRRLEQILALRRLDLSIREIKRVFEAGTAEALAAALERKVNALDTDAALIKELRAIIEDFLDRMARVDFHSEQDVRALYAASERLHEQLEMTGYRGNASPGRRAAEIVERLRPLEDVRIVLIPRCRMISSGCDTEMTYAPGTRLGRFDAWLTEMSRRRQDLTPRDFMWYDAAEKGLVWGYIYDEGVMAFDGFDLIDFDGGLYATAVARDQDDADHDRVRRGLIAWVEASEGLVRDPSRYELGHVITPPSVREALGYDQLALFLPIAVAARARDGDDGAGASSGA